MCLRLARPKVQIKVPDDINNEWAVPETFLGLIYFTLANFRQDKTSPLDFPHNYCVTPFRNFKV